MKRKTLAAVCITMLLLVASCRSSKKVRTSTIDIRVMSAVHLRWEYLSTPVDTAALRYPLNLPAKNPSQIPYPDYEE